MPSNARLSWKTAPLALGLTLSVAGLMACGQRGEVYFENLQDGAEVESPFTVQMRAKDLVVEPAASGVRKGHGHFHILIDTPVPSNPDEPIPDDAQHIHYGQGETEAVLDLEEGDHTLILQFAKGDHRPYKPQITQEVRVRVTRRNMPEPAAGGDGSMPGDTAGGMNDEDSLTPQSVIQPGVGGGMGGGGMGGPGQ